MCILWNKFGLQKTFNIEKRCPTTAKFHASFGGDYNGSALWQNRQSVFDGLA